MSSRKFLLAALFAFLLAPIAGHAQFTNNCVLKATSSSVYAIGCGTATDNGTTFAVGEALSATSITDSGLTSGNPVCASTGGLLSTTNSCGIATLGGSQTFTGAVVFTGSANFNSGSFGVNAVGFYVQGNTVFSLQSASTFVMAPTNATATGSNNYSSVEGYYVTAYWQGSASTEGAFQSIANPASGSNPLITFNHTFNANFGLGTGGTAIGQELWAYPVGLKVYTVATLPTASAYSPGDMVAVSDDMTLGVTCAGGGTNYAIAITNGSTWTCH